MRAVRRGRRAVLVEPFELAHHARRARRAQLRARRPFGREMRRAARGGQHLAAGPEQRSPPGPRAARACRSSAMGRTVGAASLSRSAAEPGLGGEVVDLRVQRAAAEAQAGLERAFHLQVEPGLDAARHELVRHRVDQQRPAAPPPSRTRGRAAAAAGCRTRRAARAAAGASPAITITSASRLATTTLHPEQPDVVLLVEAAAVRWRSTAGTPARGRRRSRRPAR